MQLLWGLQQPVTKKENSLLCSSMWPDIPDVLLSSCSSLNSSNRSLGIILVKLGIDICASLPSNFMSMGQLEHLLSLCIYFWSLSERSVLKCPPSGSVPHDLCSVVLVQSPPCYKMDSPWQQSMSPYKAVWCRDFSSDSLSDSNKHISKIIMQQHYHAIAGVPFFYHSPTKETYYLGIHLLIFFLLPRVVLHLGALGFCNSRLHLRITSFLTVFSSFLICRCAFFSALDNASASQINALPKQDNITAFYSWFWQLPSSWGSNAQCTGRQLLYFSSFWDPIHRCIAYTLQKSTSPELLGLLEWPAQARINPSVKTYTECWATWKKIL